MAKKKKEIEPPLCIECGSTSRLSTGREALPHAPKYWSKKLWVCVGCTPLSYVGCHGETTRPLGNPAGPVTRDARTKLHNRMVDPLWETAIETCGYVCSTPKEKAIVRQTARARVYAFLAERMKMTRAECHISMFDIDQCRMAWRALQVVTYPEIREWAKSRKSPPSGASTSSTGSSAPSGGAAQR